MTKRRYAVVLTGVSGHVLCTLSLREYLNVQTQGIEYRSIWYPLHRIHEIRDLGAVAE